MRNSFYLRSAVVAGVLAVCGLSLPAQVSTATGVPAVDPAAAAAGRWLAGQLVDGAVPGFSRPDWGLTIDTQWALTAVDADPAVLAQVVEAVENHVPDYAGPAFFPNDDARIAGATAKVLLAAVVAGEDVTSFGGRDMRRETLALIAGPGAGFENGRIRDRATGSDNTNIFSQSLAVIGLARSGGVPTTAVDFLLKQQCAAGFFRMFYNDKLSCDDAKGSPDGDGTAMGVQALLAARAAGIPGLDPAIDRGLDWMTSGQRPDGSFGGGVSTEGSNSNSTGLIAQALAAAGRVTPAKRAAGWVATMQLTTANAGTGPARPDIGAIAYNQESLTGALAGGLGIGLGVWRRATPQAVFALAPTPLGELGGNEPGTPPPPTATVTVTRPPGPEPTTTTTRTVAPTATETVTIPAGVPTATARPARGRASVRPSWLAPPRRASTTHPIGARTTGTPSRPTKVSSGRPDSVVDGVTAFLRGGLVGGNRFEVARGGARYVDYETTVDLALALRQAGRLPGTLNAVVALVARPEAIAAYAHGAPHDDPDARYAGPLAKLVLLSALTASGNDSAPATELVARVQGDGRITDKSRFGDQSTVATQAYGVLALTAAGRTEQARRATEALMRQQCGDGSFPVRFGGSEHRCQTGDVATTALAVQALNARPGSVTDVPHQRLDSLGRAVRVLTDRQDPDGVWRSGWRVAGGPQIPVTAAGTVALLTVGLDPAGPRSRLRSAVRPDGGLPVRPGSDSDRAASIAALPALAGASLLTTDRAVLDRAVTVPFDGPGTGAGPAPKGITPQSAALTGSVAPWLGGAGIALVVLSAGAGGGWFVARRKEGST